MEGTVSEDEITAAEAYENLHVPALFRQWASRLVETAGIRPGERVLDVACGTGVLAREAALHAGDSGFVAGLDIVAGMLAVAGQQTPSIEWRQGVGIIGEGIIGDNWGQTTISWSFVGCCLTDLPVDKR